MVEESRGTRTEIASIKENVLQIILLTLEYFSDTLPSLTPPGVITQEHQDLHINYASNMGHSPLIVRLASTARNCYWVWHADSALWWRHSHAIWCENLVRPFSSAHSSVWVHCCWIRCSHSTGYLHLGRMFRTLRWVSITSRLPPCRVDHC